MKARSLELRAGILLHLVPGFRETLFRQEAVTLAAPASDPGTVNAAESRRRPLSEDEKALLFGDAATACSSIGLLEIPVHLLKRWREVSGADSGGPAPGMTMDESGYRNFAEAVLEFLQFKQVPLPAECRCDAVVLSPRSRPLALGRTATAGGDAVCLAINLSGENARVVFSNQTRGVMAQAISGNDVDALADQSIPQHPEAPLVCLELEPRQGVLVVGGAQIHAEYFAGPSRPGVVLVLRGA